MFLVETDVGYFKENYFVHAIKKTNLLNFPHVQEQAANSADVQKNYQSNYRLRFC